MRRPLVLGALIVVIIVAQVVLFWLEPPWLLRALEAEQSVMLHFWAQQHR